ncbi:MAG: TonB-dependent receptor [Acidobacteria bacterium]|nr:TonB-dependent receptor [Acidobacteriota bacterium]
MKTFRPSSPWLIVAQLLALAISAGAQNSAQNRAREGDELTIIVGDENGVAISGARVVIEGPGRVIRCESDLAGRCRFSSLSGGPWRLHVEREAFYVLTLSPVQTSGTLEVTLVHQQEVRETVNVLESSPAIDPEQVSSEEQLSGLDIINIPYPNTRDYRYVLNFIPGVVLDQTAQPHIAGGETSQSLTELDGFNVTQPANGQLLVRVSTDALRSVDVETSRISARYGKGPAGVLALGTGIGDNHYRFAATNFVPSVQNKRGWALDKVDPRFTFSGPIQKGRIWFFDGIDGEYDNVIIPELPRGEDRDTVWRLGNLLKVQTNVTARNILTSSFLVNRLHDNHLNFSTLAPASTRPEDNENLYFASLKEQHTFAAEALFELGVAFSRYGLDQVPLGTAPYVLTPQQAEGNYYRQAHTIASRWQGIANLYLPRNWHGRHDLRFGIDIDRLGYGQAFRRSSITSLRNCPALSPNCYPLSLFSTFSGGGPAFVANREASAFVEDRWALLARTLIEAGVRYDRDDIVGRQLFSPRLAGSYVVDRSGDTKLSAGIGVVFQSTDLALIAAPFAGSRSDTFFTANGSASTFVTSFTVDRTRLLAPRFLNWSLALERKLPWEIFLKTEFLERNSIHGFVYNTPGGAGGTNFLLENTRRDHYYGLKVDLRRMFRKRYVVTASYMRSRSRSNQVLDYSLDNPVLSSQLAGPYPWDAPNRFVSWGWLPLVKGFDAGFSFEGRTGFPFAAVNDQQQIVRPPGTYRFPTYISLNVHLEKRFHALGFNWALRGGFDNVTNRQNAFTVNNDINSPQFLTFSNFDRRAFTARIRFLGRK